MSLASQTLMAEKLHLAHFMLQFMKCARCNLSALEFHRLSPLPVIIWLALLYRQFLEYSKRRRLPWFHWYSAMSEPHSATFPTFTSNSSGRGTGTGTSLYSYEGPSSSFTRAFMVAGRAAITHVKPVKDLRVKRSTTRTLAGTWAGLV